MGDFAAGIPWWIVPIVLIVAWGVLCIWVLGRLLRMDVALITKVIWAVAILAFPIGGLVAFLLLGDRTPQMERELGISRF